MSRPPMVARFELLSNDGEGKRGFSLWIPLFIIVPILLLIGLALFLVILPFLLAYILVTWDTRWFRYLRYGVPAFFDATHALLGLKIDVEDQKQRVFIDFN